MRYTKILLLIPGYHNSHYEYVGLPAGLGYLSEALDQQGGAQQCVVDMRLDSHMRGLEKTIRAFKPDLIAASLMSFRYKDHYRLFTHLKNVFPDITIAAGGPHVSTFREKMMSDCPAVDLAFVLEQLFRCLGRGREAEQTECGTDQPFHVTC